MITPTTAEELKAEQAIFTSCWNLLKEYHKIELADDPEEWAHLIDKAREIAKRSDGTKQKELSLRLTLATLAYIEEQARERGG